MFEGRTRGIFSFNPPPKIGDFGEMKKVSYFHLTSTKNTTRQVHLRNKIPD